MCVHIGPSRPYPYTSDTLAPSTAGAVAGLNHEIRLPTPRRMADQFVRTPGRVTGRYNTSPAQWDPSGATASLVVLSRPVEDLQLDLFGPLAVEGVVLMRDPATARRRALGPVHGFRPGCAHGSPIRASCSGAMGLRPRSSPDDTSHYSVQ